MIIMQLKKIVSKKLLSKSYNQKEIFSVENLVEDISFRIIEMNYLNELTDISLLNLVIKQLDNPFATSFGDYQTKDMLELYFKIYQNRILIVSAGEINREIYESYIEGVWSIIDDN